MCGSIHETMNLALQHHTAGRLVEAEAIYRQVLDADPRYPDALNLLGLLMRDTGRLEMGAQLISSAIESNNTVAQFHANLGETNRRLNRNELAVDSLRKALRLDPSLVDVYNTLGVILKSLGKPNEAIAVFSEAVQRAPNFAAAQFNLGLGLSEARRFKEAIDPLRQAVALQPGDTEALGALGTSLMYAGRMDEANEILQQLLAKSPGSAEAHVNLASFFQQQGKLDDSIAMCRKALQINPNLDQAHWNLAIALLGKGQLPEGWPEYEWRLKNEWSVLKIKFSQPRWDGGDLNGKTILLHAEQGHGDTIQFIRYVPQVAAKGGKIILRCQPELKRLLNDFPNLSSIVTYKEKPPRFDVYIPLLSLPLIFGTTLSNIPADVPYIKPAVDLTNLWKERLGPHGNTMRIGLAWAGSPIHKEDAKRSMALSQFAPLAGVANAEFHGLQKGPAADLAKNPPAEMRFIDHADEISDFADLAALIDQLDLVITVDTAVAHVAGAMAKPVWVLLPTVSDWRWMMERKDTPWYPTMRLFRQNTADQWSDVMEKVVQAAGSLHD